MGKQLKELVKSSVQNNILTWSSLISEQTLFQLDEFKKMALALEAWAR